MTKKYLRTVIVSFMFLAWAQVTLAVMRPGRTEQDLGTRSVLSRKNLSGHLQDAVHLVQDRKWLGSESLRVPSLEPLTFGPALKTREQVQEALTQIYLNLEANLTLEETTPYRSLFFVLSQPKLDRNLSRGLGKPNPFRLYAHSETSDGSLSRGLTRIYVRWPDGLQQLPLFDQIMRLAAANEAQFHARLLNHLGGPQMAFAVFPRVEIVSRLYSALWFWALATNLPERFATEMVRQATSSPASEASTALHTLMQSIKSNDPGPWLNYAIDELGPSAEDDRAQSTIATAIWTALVAPSIYRRQPKGHNLDLKAQSLAHLRNWHLENLGKIRDLNSPEGQSHLHRYQLSLHLVYGEASSLSECFGLLEGRSQPPPPIGSRNAGPHPHKDLD